MYDYQTATLAYARAEAVELMEHRAAELGVELTVWDDYDRIFLPEGVIDSRLGAAASLPDKPLSPPYRSGEQGLYLIQFEGPNFTRLGTSALDLNRGDRQSLRRRKSRPGSLASPMFSSSTNCMRQSSRRASPGSQDRLMISSCYWRTSPGRRTQSQS